MKRTITMWGVFGYISKNLNCDTLSTLRKWAIANAQDFTGDDWKRMYRRGYRCRKVKISWEE